MRLRSLLAVIVLACIAAIAASCSDEAKLATTVAFEDRILTIEGLSQPGAQIDVTLTMRNTGDGLIQPGKVWVAFLGDAGWENANLTLSGDVDAGELAAFVTTMTAPAAIGHQHLAWQPMHEGEPIGDLLEAELDLACDDGIFCNGTERLAGGHCQSGSPPCDDGESCTEDVCDETAGLCSHVLGEGCAACFSDCVPDCTGKVCGDDGCGGSCGSCPSDMGCASITGTCQSADQPGTCTNPLPLTQQGEPLLGLHVITGDTTSSLHQAVPTCNSTSTAVEMVYKFTVASPTGIDARSYGYDTVLHLRKENPATSTSECLDDSPAATVGCSDDASPPGDYGSHVAKLLQAGTYYLIVDGFDSTQFGPFTLEVKLVDNCVPQCDGRYCGGDDSCGGDCGKCADGYACIDAHCWPDPCTPQCDGKECGDDGCGGQCGTCKDGKLCVPGTSICQGFPTCDHLSPTCEPGCGETEFCGSDCACHSVTGPMPDLIVEAERLANEILFDTINVTADSCALVEQCVGGSGQRKVVRFSVEAVNQGTATLTVPPPDQRPDLFTFSACHGHYHFNGFASYALLDESGNTVLTGHKQAYCMEDTRQVLQGPQIGCSKVYSCGEQGIQAGWSDLYGNALDCQWLDITDIPPGKYQIQVTLNPSRVFEEISLSNNTAVVPVTIQ